MQQNGFGMLAIGAANSALWSSNLGSNCIVPPPATLLILGWARVGVAVGIL